jgi:hypothetical protein
MQEELKKIKSEVIEEDKLGILKDTVRLENQLSFLNKEFKEKEAEAKKVKDKKEREHQLESLEKSKLQSVHPTADKLKTHKKYYEFLCEL